MRRILDALGRAARASRGQPAPEGPRASPDTELFKDLADSTAAAVFIYQDDRVRFANARATALSGIPHVELLNTVFWELSHPDSRALFRMRAEPHQRGEPGPPRLEACFLAREGEPRWLDVTFAPTTWEGRPAGLAVAFDVSERKLAEQSLREAERRMRDILENVQLIAVLRDREGEITFANPFFLELVGAEEEEEVVGRDWFSTFVPVERRDQEHETYKQHLHDGAITPHEESEIVTRHEERRLISWNHTLLHDVLGQVVGSSSIGSDITDRRRVEQQLVHDAFHDALTGLPNRALFVDHLAGALARSHRRPERLLAVLFLDLDRFKVVNDSLGHLVGDQLLVEVSRLLLAAVRPGDTVARMGGDEFTIQLEDLDDSSDATRVAERIHTALLSPFNLNGHEVFVTVSIGIALSTREYQRAEPLLRDADTAMYQAKTNGKARSQIFDTSMHDRAMQVLALENELRRAAERKSFLLHYQPIVELDGGRIVGLEALVRWEHPERGLVSPVEFVPLAEEMGLIYEIGEWVLREACRDARAWLDAFPIDLQISVKLSGKQFSQGNLVDRVAGVLFETSLEPKRLKLEITESVIMENAEAAIAMLARLKELGAGVCIDDFGTGYSSLSYLVRFPADTLKVDRSFVTALSRGARNAQIVQTIATLGRSLGMQVVAEGVEAEDQRSQLVALGCHYGQGFLFSRPVDRARVEVLLAEETRRLKQL